MRKLEIILTEEQYQHIMAEISYGNRTNLQEEAFGGFEITLHVAQPDIYSYMEMKMFNKIDLGEVEWGWKWNSKNKKQ